MLVLRFTTAHMPKNPSAGFIFGTDKEKRDILLSTTRKTGISGKQFAITFHTTTGAVIIRNLSKRRTKIKEQGDKPTKLSTQKVLFGTNVTSIYLPSLELNISKPWQDGEYSTVYSDFLAGLASVEPDIHALRLQSSAATGSSAASVLNAYTRTTTRLGQGSSGVVYQGIHRKTGELVAIKIFGKRTKEAKTEGNILNLLHHVHIIELYCLMDDGDDGPQLIMEYAPLGNLEEQCQAQRFWDRDGRSIIRQTLEGLSYIHGEHIIHRDLKPTNILVMTRQPIHIKLADFTSSTTKDVPSSYCGTRKYMAPEISNGSYSFKIDIWSVGVIGTELWIGLPEGDPVEWRNLAGFVLDSRVLTPDDQSFLSWLLEPDYGKRPTADLCLGHNFTHRDPTHVMLPLLDDRHGDQITLRSTEEWPEGTVVAASAAITSSIPSTARAGVDVWVEETRGIDQSANPTSFTNKYDIERWVTTTRHQPLLASSREIPEWVDWESEDYKCWAPNVASVNPGVSLPSTQDLAASFANESTDRGVSLNPQRKKLCRVKETRPGNIPKS
ncbi:Hormonally up-regulated neu tumor-associated kinase [Fusarium oxysporum f. sp. cubense]|uniref:Hormonally up-regulated neu tumor-associated kinase n=2 Tax=Fusarium oxysporum f. sp. cubense TaxID=61366 RepID=N4U7S5_FUSC1|nr:Hormonally up-regulated neu tumor-associated kinase [Fusarium oxysporum f. sp. cubense race 1]TVY73791.1 Hormonally up-regulated neu tumor-associated kinase [Fusarium oxysporum f. sp. cubense]